MSYCCCSKTSDVYVFAIKYGRKTKYCISFAANKYLKDVSYFTREETKEQLVYLKKIGLKIPERAIRRLRREIKEEFHKKMRTSYGL